MKVVPPGGTLTYTWARRGQQPQVKTSGKRKGYTVFGVIEYFTGASFIKGRKAASTLQRTLPFSKGSWSKPPGPSS